MKRLIVLLAVVMVAMTIYAGVFGNTRNVSGIVFFLDGHKETFQSITIPYAGDKDFKGIDESGNKRTVKDMYQACGVGYIPILRLVAQCDG